MDLAETEQVECDVISSYLPQQLSSEELDAIVITTIAKLNATTVKDMGKVIRCVFEKSFKCLVVMFLSSFFFNIYR